MVTINSISQQALHQLLSADAASEIAVGVEVEWFADREESIIGVVGFGGQYRGWSYAVLKRDTPSGFRVLVRQEHFFTRHTARVMLLRQMVAAEAVELERLAA
jgi:hypothetical protein